MYRLDTDQINNVAKKSKRLRANLHQIHHKEPMAMLREDQRALVGKGTFKEGTVPVTLSTPLTGSLPAAWERCVCGWELTRPGGWKKSNVPSKATHRIKTCLLCIKLGHTLDA